MQIVSTINDIQNHLNSTGRIIVRSSGTEPLIRIMIEGENYDEILLLANNLKSLILSKTTNIIN
ncbi:hypothetical protein FC961_04170 [Clostridium botulinum]|nr:hypothetical protein [Clostridium botulinum]NFO91751.1 hypothetical protein [Clostridium botulinum]